jgi:hypothetical protein
MQVVQIGDVTTGKKCWVSHYTTPTTLEQKTEIQITVMQPIVLKIVNADGFEIISTD